MIDPASLFIIVFRFLAPLLIFRFPLAGGLVAIVADATDVMILEKYGQGFFGGERYHNMDKFFDMYYLTIEFFVVRHWANVLARRTAKVLYWWRLAGFIAFEATGFRPFFLLAPNIFEYFYIAWLSIQKFSPNFVLTKKKLIIILLVVGIPKIVLEYIMHFAYINQTWVFFRDYVFWWLYK